jgi:hypothetical protein
MMDKINIDTNLIDEFRDKVNERIFFQEKLKNVDGKNHWNILCSAMDWITVTCEGLPEIQLNSDGFGPNSIDTLNLMQFIIAVDVLVESIKQIYRVLDGSNNYPLSESKEVFNHKQLTDDIYFKHIRAVFSTHPINLNSLDGVKRQDGERFYGSWVARHGININEPQDKPYDYYVLLYSNNPDKDETYQLGIRIDEINEYATLRFQLLESLISKVDLLIDKHIAKYRISPIPNIDNVLEQLKVLLNESQKRLGQYNGYAGTINYLIDLNSIQIEKFEFDDYFTNIFNEYKEHMALEIPKIREELQEMNFDNYRTRMMWKGYEFQKIYDYLNDGVHPVGKEYFNGMIAKGKLPKKLATLNDFRLNRMMLDAYLFHITKKLNKDRIGLNEIIKLYYPY